MEKSEIIATQQKFSLRHLDFIIGALLWICTVQFFILAHIAAIQAFPAYSATRQVLSDLGISHCITLKSGSIFCSPAHTLFTISLLIQGSCMAMGSILMRQRLHAQFALLFFGVAGCSLYGIAAFPENGVHALHVAFAAAHCVFANLGLLLLSHSSSIGKLYRWMALGGGTIGSIASVLLLFPTAVMQYVGVVERIAVYPFPAMLIMLGMFVLFKIFKNSTTNPII